MKKTYLNLLCAVFTAFCSCNTDEPPIAQGIEETPFTYQPTGEISGYEYVDLGLSVKWAAKNLGAENFYDNGYYFAWGEVTVKENYNWQTYAFGSTGNFTKYAQGDEDTHLKPEDDAATVNMGENWRIPTHDEISELRENCQWQYAKVNGIIGFIVTGGNGNSIFVPASGYMSNTELKMQGKSANFWGANLTAYDATKTVAYELVAYRSTDNSVNRYAGTISRYYGEPIRAVSNAQ
ncbi:MAG: hypothetical protein IKR41_00785 [Bacteroidales bacterium]|nr:hypothetical protein [Bacteroidales bacterium]